VLLHCALQVTPSAVESLLTVTRMGTVAVLTRLAGGVSVKVIVGVGVDATMVVTAEAELEGLLEAEDAVIVTALPVGTEDGAV